MLKTYTCDQCGALVGRKGKNDQCPDFMFTHHPRAGSPLKGDRGPECNGMLCGHGASPVEVDPQGRIIRMYGVRCI